MPVKSAEWADRIKDVEKEYHVAQIASQLLRPKLTADPSALRTAGLRRRDAVRFEARLEATYLIRLYAEFEAGLREVWRLWFRRTTFPAMEVLIDRIGAAREISPDVIAAVHQVRAYRNVLLHDVRGGSSPVAIDQARSRLCSYFGWLPLDW